MEKLAVFQAGDFFCYKCAAVAAEVEEEEEVQITAVKEGTNKYVIIKQEPGLPPTEVEAAAQPPCCSTNSSSTQQLRWPGIH